MVVTSLCPLPLKLFPWTLWERAVFSSIDPSSSRSPPQEPHKPWFNWKVDQRGHGTPEEECLSEDYTFCRHAIQNGWQPKLDTTIQCYHIGFSKVSYLNVRGL
jgi:hypothetical protein